MTACVQLSVGPGIQWKERWDGREKWGPQSSVPRMQEVYPPLLPVGLGWRGLDQGGLREQGGCGGYARAAEGSTKSE